MAKFRNIDIFDYEKFLILVPIVFFEIRLAVGVAIPPSPQELLTELSPAAGQRIRDGVGLTDRVCHIVLPWGVSYSQTCLPFPCFGSPAISHIFYRMGGCPPPPAGTYQFVTSNAFFVLSKEKMHFEKKMNLKDIFLGAKFKYVPLPGQGLHVFCVPYSQPRCPCVVSFSHCRYCSQWTTCHGRCVWRCGAASCSSLRGLGTSALGCVPFAPR